jgi:type I restriction enzyme S subunit
MNLKPYPEYKESGVEWIGEIPDSWDIKKLDYYTEIIPGYPFNSNFFSDEGMPLIRIRDLDNFETVVKWSGEIVKEVLVEKNDILVGMDGDFDVVVWKGEQALLNQRIFRINSKNKLKKEYLKYFLDFPMKQINKITMSTTVKHLAISDVKKSEFPFPSINEQNYISSFLDKKTSEIDLTIEKDTRLIELLKEKRTALINHVVTKGLDPTVKMKDSGVEWIGEIPEDWEIKKLKLISTIVLGKMLTPLDKGGYYLKPYLRAQNISWEHVNTDEIKEMWFSKNELNIYRLHKDDLLVSEGGKVGRTAIWKEEMSECYIQNSVHKVTLNPENNSKYFLYAFESCGNSNFFSSIVNRVSIAHLTREKLKEITFPVPNKLEQDRITDYLNVKTRIIDQTIQKIQENIDLLEEYKKSLIHHVVTGKVNVINKD